MPLESRAVGHLTKHYVNITCYLCSLYEQQKLTRILNSLFGGLKLNLWELKCFETMVTWCCLFTYDFFLFFSDSDFIFAQISSFFLVQVFPKSENKNYTLRYTYQSSITAGENLWGSPNALLANSTAFLHWLISAYACIAMTTKGV